MAITNITSENFQAEVVQAAQPVLIDFYADWCGPCKRMAPLIAEIAAERPDIKVCKVNVDEQQALAERFDVISIPTLVVFVQGEAKSRLVGAQPKTEVLKLLS